MDGLIWSLALIYVVAEFFIGLFMLICYGETIDPQESAIEFVWGGLFNIFDKLNIAGKILAGPIILIACLPACIMDTIWCCIWNFGSFILHLLLKGG